MEDKPLDSDPARRSAEARRSLSHNVTREWVTSRLTEFGELSDCKWSHNLLDIDYKSCEGDSGTVVYHDETGKGMTVGSKTIQGTFCGSPSFAVEPHAIEGQLNVNIYTG